MEEPQLEKSESTESEEKQPEIEEENANPEVTEKTTETQATKKSKEKKVKVVDENVNEPELKNVETSDKKNRKYSDIMEENKQLQAYMKQSEKKIRQLQKEKEQVQQEHGRTIQAKKRLESLCRELQKQNKQIKEESLQRIKEEEEKRKGVSAKFQSTLSEITVLMQQNNDNNSKLRDENLEMKNKFKTVCEQYELREQQIEKMSQQMKLESQLAEAKLTKLKIEMVAEKELLENEKKQLLIELAAYQHKCQELQKAEVTLKNQITMYTEKYDKFQGALAKSNELYGGFKTEMEKMSKKIAKLEKETSVWKMRWENNHKTLLQVAAEKQQKASELSLAARQLAQLQKLCRTLQADRSSLLMQLKNEGITPKLSGECNSGPENESESRKSESETPLPSDLEVLKNGKDHEESPLPDNEESDSVEANNEPKESSPEIENDNEAEDLQNGRGDEISKTESKPKKGKEGSKKKKK